MGAIVRVSIDRVEGWVTCRFPFDRATVDVLKSTPGYRWDKRATAWFVPLDAWEAVLKHKLRHEIVNEVPLRQLQLPESMAQHMRPYQLEAANFLVGRAGGLLSMSQRVGKTICGISAAAALMEAGIAKWALVVYLNSVRSEWRRQLRKWAHVELHPLEGLDAPSAATVSRLRSTPYSFVGCHYEIIAAHVAPAEDDDEDDDGDDLTDPRPRARALDEIADGRPFVMLLDECQSLANRKSGRSAAVRALARHPMCVGRYGLSATPMRNTPRNLWHVLDVLNPNSMGRGYWQFAKAYAGAVLDDFGHWDDKGESNPEELAARLAVVSYRKTRAEVAPWLPKTDRVVVDCTPTSKALKRYRKMEELYAKQARSGLRSEEPSAGDRDALRILSQATSEMKIPTALERIQLHAERGTKFLVFAYFHETLKRLDDALKEAEAKGAKFPPRWMAGGWMSVVDRHAAIEEWRAVKGSAFILLNILSSGIGIDLADAEIAMCLETCWVPADLRQAEDRIQDVHLGKRTAPPVIEYLLARNTVDEAMCGVILKKIRIQEQVVGHDPEAKGLSTSLRGAGVVGASHLGLASTDHETVTAALRSIRDRWLSDAGPKDAREALANEVGSLWEDDEPAEETAEAEETAS